MVVDVALVALWTTLLFTTAGPPRWAAMTVTTVLAIMSITASFWPEDHQAQDALLARAAGVVRARHPNSAQLTKAMTAQLHAGQEQGDLTVYYSGNSAEIKLWNMPSENVRATVERDLTISLDTTARPTVIKRTDQIRRHPLIDWAS